MRYIITILFAFSLQEAICSGITITFVHQFNGQEIQLDSKGEKQDTLFTRIKYYIGNVVLKFESGEVYTHNQYHLIDVEKQIEGFQLAEAPKGTIKEIQFSIGVDSLTNANGIMDGDLDPMNGMYWAWNSGYINFKVEGIIKDDEEFQYHIGGFLPPFQTYQVATLYPEFSSSKEEISIDVDLGRLLKEVDLPENKKILSPSKKSVEFSEALPQIFSITE